MLPAHVWDDDLHRAAIHTAFEIWSDAYEHGAWPRARKWRRELSRLCADAVYRKRTVRFKAAMAAVLAGEAANC